jgi:hypothetical protein
LVPFVIDEDEDEDDDRDCDCAPNPDFPIDSPSPSSHPIPSQYKKKYCVLMRMRAIQYINILYIYNMLTCLYI